MSDLLKKATIFFDQNELTESLEMVNEIILSNKGNRDAFLLRGRIHYKMQNWGASMNDYCSVLELDPDNQEAKSGIEMAKSILGYFTPDMFNP
jgi:nicotinate-nucleotide adenylyltransferase